MPVVSGGTEYGEVENKQWTVLQQLDLTADKLDTSLVSLDASLVSLNASLVLLDGVLNQVSVTPGDVDRGAVPIKIPSYALGDHHGGYQAAVAYTYAVGTNKIILADACKHIALYSTADVFLVFDSSVPATDLADGVVRIFIPANTFWERTFSGGKTNLYFATTDSGVTAEVHVEGYE